MPQASKRFEQYFAPFAMEEQAFAGLARAAQSIDLDAHLKLDGAVDPAFVEAATKEKGIKESWVTPSSKAKEAPAALYSVNKENGVALFEIRGTMTKYGSSFSSVPAMTKLSSAMRQAARDSDVKAIVLAIDSPGGTSAGTAELSDEVAKAAAKKPVYAWIDDLGASAAYRVASQATKIYASRGAMVGSIGTYMVVTDWSRAAMEEGAKVHVIRAGEFKGAGTPGTEITEKQLGKWQEMVNALNEEFLADVANGRKLPLEKVRALADGRVHVAQGAMEMGLVDGVKSLEEVFGEAGATKKKGKPMSEENDNRPRAATLKEIKAAFPKAKEDFFLACLEKEFTLDQARAAFGDHLQTENERLAKENAELKTSVETLTKERDEVKASLDKAGKGLRAVEGSGQANTGAGTLYEQWKGLVAEAKGRGMDQEKAITSVERSHPGLRQRAVEEFNAQTRRAS